MQESMTDEQLMLSYQQGEAVAMDELLRRYKNPVYRFAYRLCQDSAEAQDIAQEVFLRVHQYRDDYAPVGKFCTWIFSITHNLCVSHFRKKRWTVFWPRKDEESQELADFESPDPSPTEIAANNEVSEILKQCVQGLPFLQREALILREYENMDYGEIAKILKKSLGTVKTLIYRARQNLKIKLLPYMDEFKGGSQ